MATGSDRKRLELAVEGIAKLKCQVLIAKR